jgi:hypothetical protein
VTALIDLETLDYDLELPNRLACPVLAQFNYLLVYFSGWVAGLDCYLRLLSDRNSRGRTGSGDRARRHVLCVRRIAWSREVASGSGADITKSPLSPDLFADG